MIQSNLIRLRKICMLLNAAVREIRLQGNDVIVDPAIVNQTPYRNVESTLRRRVRIGR